MPVVVLLDGLPVVQDVGPVQRVRPGVQDHVEVFGDGADADQRALEQRCQAAHGAGAQGRALEKGIVRAREDPGFVWNARSVGTGGEKVAARFDHAYRLLFLLRDDVAEDAALLLLEVLLAGAQLVEDAARDEGGGRQLRSRVIELLASGASEILVDGDVLEAAVALEVGNARAGENKELLHFGVGGAPVIPVVARVLDQHFVSAHRLHLVIQAFAAACGVAFHVVDRVGMHHGAGRPRASGDRWARGDHLRRMRAVGAEVANSAVGGAWRLVAGDHPGTRDRVFAQFHKR